MVVYWMHRFSMQNERIIKCPAYVWHWWDVSHSYRCLITGDYIPVLSTFDLDPAWDILYIILYRTLYGVYAYKPSRFYAFVFNSMHIQWFLFLFAFIQTANCYGVVMHWLMLKYFRWLQSRRYLVQHLFKMTSIVYEW